MEIENILKEAKWIVAQEDWLEKEVRNPATGRTVKVKSLSPKEREKYKPKKDSHPIGQTVNKGIEVGDWKKPKTEGDLHHIITEVADANFGHENLKTQNSGLYKKVFKDLKKQHGIKSLSEHGKELHKDLGQHKSKIKDSSSNKKTGIHSSIYKFSPNMHEKLKSSLQNSGWKHKETKDMGEGVKHHHFNKDNNKVSIVHIPKSKHVRVDLHHGK